MSDEWIFEHMKPEDVIELNYKSSKIVRNLENGITLHLSLSNQHCMNLVHDWYNATQQRDLSSITNLYQFFQGFIEYINEHLIEENLDYKSEDDIGE